MFQKLFALFILFFISFIAQSQDTQFSGKVLNSRNEILPGATIVIKEIDKQLVTNVEGKFTVILEKGKKYSFTFSNTGYTSKTIDDIVLSDNIIDNSIEVVLSESAKNDLTGVTVIGTSRRKESTNALLAFQKNNTSLSSGLAADFIRRTPDRNTGEVLKRVSGTSIQDNKFVVIRGLSDRYNQALLNNAPLPSSEPDKKAFSFDIIPSSMIDNVIINKTATPDLPGEFAGGLVQVNTRDIPLKNALSVSISLGYNSQSTFKDFTSNKRNSTDWLGFDNGDRSLPSSIPDIADYRSLTDEQKIAMSKNFNGEAYVERNTTAAPITTLNITWSNTKKFKNGGAFGTIVSLSHRKSQIIYDEVERGRYEQVRTPIFEGSEIQNRYAVNAGALVNFSYVKGRHKISFRNIFNQLYEDNYINRTLNNTGRLQIVSLRSSFLNQRSLYSGQLEGEHQLTKSGIKFSWNGNFAYNYKSQPDFRTAQYVQSISGLASDFQLDEDDTRRFFSKLKDYTAGFGGSLSVPFTMGGKKQTFKMGGSSLLRFRDFNARVFRYKAASTATDTKIPFDQAFLESNINSNGLFLEEQTQNTDKYFGISALNAGYLMMDNKVGDKLRLIWGVRAEFFEQFLSSRDLSLKRVRTNTEKWDVLPSLNATYSVNAKNQLRGAVSKTVARPEFREIAPFQFFDYEQIYGISGDTGLRRTSITNADLRYEFYPKSGEIISAGILYKKFKDPIELRMDPGSNGDRWLFGYTNAQDATLVGAEFEIRKGLDFISEKLKNFMFLGNATVLDSKVTVSTQQASGAKTDLDRPLYGQSPYLINAGFQYTDPKWSATLLYNRIGPRLYLVGDPTGAGFYDIYEKPRNLLDMQLARKVFAGKGEWKITISDILNNKYAFYDNPSEKAGYDYDKGDRINYSYKPGTTITVGFTYDFDLKRK
ncbi:MAG: carboxypeptidase-like regulatory domain-containing protein [Rhizobacter sp.]|nr:carboxypeptidase-like regulatory domain-containing protein [Ferruginibacter sp.]